MFLHPRWWFHHPLPSFQLLSFDFSNILIINTNQFIYSDSALPIDVHISMFVMPLLVMRTTGNFRSSLLADLQFYNAKSGSAVKSKSSHYQCVEQFCRIYVGSNLAIPSLLCCLQPIPQHKHAPAFPSNWNRNPFWNSFHYDSVQTPSAL